MKKWGSTDLGAARTQRADTGWRPTPATSSQAPKALHGYRPHLLFGKGWRGFWWIALTSGKLTPSDHHSQPCYHIQRPGRGLQLPSPAGSPAGHGDATVAGPLG